jgi:hypothetical protein
MGHVIGLGHSADGVMDENLAPGQRATPDLWYGAAEHVDGVQSVQPVQPVQPVRSVAPAAQQAAMAAVQPVAMPFELPASSVPAAQTSAAPTIDWRTMPAAAAATGQTPERSGGNATTPWQTRFVNHLGASAEKLNPNAALRLQLPAASDVTPRVTRL